MNDTVYYILVAVVSAIMFYSALVLSMGYLMGAPEFWERYIEMPVFIVISLTVLVESVYRALKSVKQGTK